MRFPSIDSLIENSRKTFVRFPLPIIIAFIGSLVMSMLIDQEIDWPDTMLVKIVFSSLIGLSITLGCALLAERQEKKGTKWGIHAGGLLLTLLYGLLYAPGTFEEYHHVIIFFVLLIVVHLFVCIAPYINIQERTGFWQFNEALFVRVIISGIFSGVLFAGLSVALFAIDTLLKFEVQEEAYARLFVWIAGVFNTWFFLSGIPRDYEENNIEKPFPKGLKIFTQYILIPLATVYLVILYAYTAKIIMQWSLPKGWVSMLIMCYSLVGILAILLVSPLRDDTANSWVRLFTRFFFIALFPLIILLYIAIVARINQYGITELRYYLMLLGAWLLFIAVYFIFFRKKNIKVIPYSLAILGVLSLFGPWSVFSISKHSQLNRLERILVRNGIWKEGGTAKPSGKEISSKDREQVQDIIDYMVERNYVLDMQYLYSTDLKAVKKSIYKKEGKEEYRWDNYVKMNDTLLAMLNIEPVRVQAVYQNDYYSVEQYSVNTAGYRLVYNYSFEKYTGKEEQVVYMTPTDSLTLKLLHEKIPQQLIISHAGNSDTLHLQPLLAALKDKDDEVKLTMDEMTIMSTGVQPYKFIVSNVNVYSDEQGEIQSITAYLLIP